MNLTEIAERLDGVIEGDAAVDITGVASMAGARTGDITFLANPKYAAGLATTQASAVIVGLECERTAPCALVRVADPDQAFSVAARLFAPPVVEYTPGVHPSAVVAEDAVLGEGITIGPHCTIEPGVRIGARSIIGAGSYIGHNVTMGEDCHLYPLTVIEERTELGCRVIIHSGAVIGSDGFGYEFTGEEWKKTPQTGIVVLGDDVEIGANTTIDRARFGRTVLDKGVKIDNLVQIAHNVVVGEHSVMAAHVGVAGSALIGKGVRIGGQSGLAGHIHVGDGATLGAGSGATKDIKAGAYVSDYPAVEHQKAAERYANINRLPVLKKRVAALEQRIAELEKGLES